MEAFSLHPLYQFNAASATSAPSRASGFPLVFRALSPPASPSLQPYSSSSPLSYYLPSRYRRFLCLCLALPLLGRDGLAFWSLTAFWAEAKAMSVRICTNHSCFTCGLSSSHAVCCLICWVFATSNCTLLESISYFFPIFMYLSRNDHT